MRINSLFASSLLAAALSMGIGSPAIAKPGNSAADVAAIHDYTLTTGFLEKWEAIATDPAAPSCSLMTLNLHGDSLNEMIANYDARPGNHAYLSSHGLSFARYGAGDFGTWPLRPLSNCSARIRSMWRETRHAWSVRKTSRSMRRTRTRSTH